MSAGSIALSIAMQIPNNGLREVMKVPILPNETIQKQENRAVARRPRDAAIIKLCRNVQAVCSVSMNAYFTSS